MGFYGNITNTSRTQFVFDRTYSNRAQMDSYANTDGVYIGRYVLVEYDSALAADWCTDVYMDDGVFYTSPLKENNTKVLYGFGNIVKGKYLRVPAAYVDPVTKEEIIHNFDATAENKYKDLIYLILETELAKEPNVELMSESTSTYVENYQIDMKQYGEGRGYDSTVWQKVYTDNHERYVMIAELNTVVPTFGITADAPTMSPVVPHFDVDSSNVYYKVHWQPSWGLRVKTASPTATAVPIHDDGTTISGADMIQLGEVLDKALPSDETTKWSRTTYDASTGTIYNYKYEASFTPEGNISSGSWKRDVEGADIPAAIFYNREGFNPKIVGEVEGYADKIAIEPTGKSGYLYNKHDGTGGVEAQIDTQELSIILPSIGNTISKVWDLVYGGKEVNGSAKRNLNITWSDGSIVPNLSGLRMVTKKRAGYGYEPQQVNTIAGAINSVHDLMGMIVQEKENLTSIDPNKLNTEYIYFDKSTGKYYRKNKNFTLNPIATNAINWDNRYKVINQYNNEDWDLINGHTNYYLDYLQNNPKDGNGNIFPNYILERYMRYEDKEYYKVTAPDPNSNLAVKGEDLLKGVFQPKTYYTPIVKSILVDTQMIETRSFVISTDETYKAESNYYNLTYEPLPDNARFYVQGAYYKISKATAVTNPNVKDFEKRLYFVKEGERYVRATIFDDTNKTTYYTLDFEAENGNLQNTQYFAVNSKVENGLNYVEQVTYIVDPSITSQAILNSLTSPRYITDGFGAYIRATTYEAGQTYYYKQSKLVLVPGEVVVSPENLDEVVLMLFENNKGYCYHIPRGQGGLNGFDEFIVLNNHLLSTYTKNLVQITANPVNDVYEPNTHYYQVDDIADPLYGSYIFDPEDIPVADRIYYKPLALQLGEKVENGKDITKVYEPFKYYYKNANGDYILDTRKTYTAGTTLYEKNGLYIYNDTTGLFPYGTEWNLNIRTVPANIQLAERIESWGVEELKGFARHYNTIHGLILRLNDILEQKNELIRDYDTAQGLMNKIKDILFLFGDLKPNEVMIVNNYGRVESSSINGDNWINPQIQNGQIQISHNPMLDSSEQSSKWLIKNLADNVTPSFGSKIELLSVSVAHDAAGHLVQNAIKHEDTHKQTITLPSISFSETVGKNGGNIITSVAATDLNTTEAKFATTKSWVGSLQLDVSSNLIDNDKTGIVSTDTITGAFGKINTALNSAYDWAKGYTDDEIETLEEKHDNDVYLIADQKLVNFRYKDETATSTNGKLGISSARTINEAFANINDYVSKIKLDDYNTIHNIVDPNNGNTATIDERINNFTKDRIDYKVLEYNTDIPEEENLFSYKDTLIRSNKNEPRIFYKSTDKGATWTTSSTSMPQSFSANYKKVYSNGDRILFVCRSAESNGSTYIRYWVGTVYDKNMLNWHSSIGSFDNSNILVHMGTKYDFISNGDDNVAVLRYGSLMSMSTIPLPEDMVAHFGICDNGNSVVISGRSSDNKMYYYYSTNLGETWTKVTKYPNSNNIRPSSTNIIAAQGLFLERNENTILYSVDNGVTWNYKTLPVSENYDYTANYPTEIKYLNNYYIVPVTDSLSGLGLLVSINLNDWEFIPWEDSSTLDFNSLVSMDNEFYILKDHRNAEGVLVQRLYTSSDLISWKDTQPALMYQSKEHTKSIKSILGEKYNFEETKTYNTWIDGKPIYRKVIRAGSFTPSSGNNGLCVAPLNINAQLGHVISLQGYGLRGGAALDVFPYAHATDTNNIALGVNGYNTNTPSIFLQFSTNGRPYTNIYFIIEYTKKD